VFAPSFWWKPGRGRLFAPLAAIYGAAAWLRLQKRGRDAGLAVICLGNLTVGGAGKTPAALTVARILLAAHERPFFLSRGYGGRIAGPVLVNPAVYRATDVGDEPLLLARLAPTIVSRDRVAGAQAARFGGARIIVMDDGFQNPSLKKDLSILVIDSGRGIGNGRILPAGPLRAPLATQMARAQALLVVGSGDGAEAVIDMGRRRGLAIFHGHLEPESQHLAALRGRKVLAFAGIADPQKFFATLTGAGIAVTERWTFADHHRYTADDAQTLLARAQAQNLVLLTTEKDHVRLIRNPQLSALAARTSALPVRLVIDEEHAFQEMILAAVRRG
jgi:tetraacyldisaccharide 4'-kinase